VAGAELVAGAEFVVGAELVAGAEPVAAPDAAGGTTAVPGSEVAPLVIAPLTEDDAGAVPLEESALEAPLQPAISAPNRVTAPTALSRWLNARFVRRVPTWVD
jgi:hypothetical protein